MLYYTGINRQRNDITSACKSTRVGIATVGSNFLNNAVGTNPISSKTSDVVDQLAKIMAQRGLT